MLDVSALTLYAFFGLLGGIVYVLMPPMVKDRALIVQHVVLGAIVGAIAYLLLLASDPSAVGTPASYVATLGVGYMAIDFLKQLLKQGGQGGFFRS